MVSNANEIISSQFLFHLNELIFVSCLSFCIYLGSVVFRFHVSLFLSHLQLEKEKMREGGFDVM